MKKAGAPSSLISNLNGRYRHFADDYLYAPPAGGGCAPCGSASPEVAGGPQRLGLRRVYYPDAGFYGSLGYQWGLNVDIWLTLHAPGAVPPYIPLPGWVIEVSQPDMQPNDADRFVDPDVNGVFVNPSRATARDLVLYDGTAVTNNPWTATTAVLTQFDGTRFVFEIYAQVTGSSPRLGRMQYMEDRNGNRMTWTWKYAITDPSLTSSSLRTKLRQIHTVTDAYGRTATFTYRSSQVGGQWVVDHIALPGGQQVSYTYGSQANLSGSTSSQLKGVTLPGGSAVTITATNDAPLSCIRVVINDPAAEATSRGKSIWLSKTQWTNPDNPSDIRSQIFGRLRMARNGANEQTYARFTQTYGGAAHSYVIDHGQAYGIVHAFGTNPGALYMRDDLSGDPLSWMGPTWGAGWTLTEQYAHDARSAVTAYTDGVGNSIAYDRDASSSAVQEQTFADATTRETTYNAFLQPLTVIDRLGRQVVSTYDAHGNRLTRTDGFGTPQAATTTWTYWQVSDTDAERGKPGQVRSVSDPNGHVTTYAYHPSGDLKRVTEPADRVGDPQAATVFTWDAAGRLLTTTDASGRTATYTHDARNRVVGIAYADGSHELTTYGAGVASNVVIAREDRNGNRTEYAYDAAGRMITTIEAAGSAVAVTSSRTYLPGTTDHLATETRHGELTSHGYDARLRQIATTVHPRAGVSLVSSTTYDNADRVIGRTDPYGRATRFVYDVDGRIVRTVRELVPGGLGLADPATVARAVGGNPAYVVEETTYDAEGQVLARIDGRGIRSIWIYDARGRVVEQVEADATVDTGGAATLLPTPVAARTLFAYDAASNRITMDLPRSFIRAGGGAWSAGSEGVFRTSWTYTGRHLVATMTVADGLNAGGAIRPERATTTSVYSPTRKLAQQTDALGRITDYRYGVCCDRLVEVEDALGAITGFTYDAHGNRLTITDPNGLTTATAYDARHRVGSITNAAGETTTFLYDDNLSDGVGIDLLHPAAIAGLGLASGSDGSATRVTDPLGHSSIEIRDALGRPVRRIDALGHAQTMGYDTMSGGLVVTTTTDALAHVTASHADAAGRVRQMVDAIGQITSQSFDAAGNRIAVLDANGVGMTCSYDARNREVTCADTAGDSTGRTYDTHGNQVGSTDGQGEPSSAVFDARDRRVSTTDRISATTTFTYDLADNLLTIIDAETGTTTYAYDARNLLISETFPKGQATGHGTADPNTNIRTYTYDPGRRLATRNDQAGVVTTYAYDAANRLVTRSYTDGTSDAFAYDAAGRLTAADSGRYGTDVDRAYDAANRLTSETQTMDGAAYTVGYAYDADNRRVTLSYPGGSTASESWTDRNQLSGVVYGGVTVASRIYDAGGRLASTTSGNGLIESRTYVTGDRLVVSIHTPGMPGDPIVSGFGYTYDANKRKTAETDSAPTAAGQTFGYDDQDRLITWTAPGATQAWTLSPVGDWNSTTRNGVTENRTHTRVHEVTQTGLLPLHYDRMGNLIRDGQGQRYAWDAENRMTAALVPGVPAIWSTASSYAYDALGRRVAKTVQGVTTHYIHDGARVIREIDMPAVAGSASAIASDGTSANAALTPATGGILPASPGLRRVNFQTPTSPIPAGYYADKGRTYGTRTHGSDYGWVAGDDPSPTSRVTAQVSELNTHAHGWQPVRDNGLRGTYFATADFSGTAQQRLDGTVDFDWGSGEALPGLGSDTFSVRWTGLVAIPATGAWTFSTTSTDGVRLWIDGALVIDNWTDHAVTVDSGTVTLSAGQHTVRMDYYDHTGAAVAQLAWTGPGVSQQIIPTSALTTPRVNTWEIAVPNGIYPVVLVCGDPVSLAQANHILIEGSPVADPDPGYDWTIPTYQAGDFDGYVVAATVSDGKLSIMADTQAFDPKLCWIEIGPAGTAEEVAALVAAAQPVLANFIADATARTAETVPATDGVREFVYGSYVDEVVAYTQTVAGVTKRYYPHYNHLYSVAALTAHERKPDGTVDVVERYTYDAYGKQKITDANGNVIRAKSSVGWDRGFTGYVADSETGLLHARARQYSPTLGRFVSRDFIPDVVFRQAVQRRNGIPNMVIRLLGLNAYSARFIPIGLDPSGHKVYEDEWDKPGWQPPPQDGDKKTVCAPESDLPVSCKANCGDDIVTASNGWSIGVTFPVAPGVEITVTVDGSCGVQCDGGKDPGSGVLRRKATATICQSFVYSSGWLWGLFGGGWSPDGPPSYQCGARTIENTLNCCPKKSSP